MTGDDFLKLASQLFVHSRTPSEAMLRTVISRAYYGAYHLTLEYLVEVGFPETSDHGVPPLWLENARQTEAIAAGRHLRDLYAARRKADYDLKHPRAIRVVQNVDFVKDQIERASDVKALLEKCRTEPARSQIVEAIKSFRHKPD